MNEIHQDIDIFGNENYNGTPKEYFDRDALKNALTMWLMTKRGDFIDSPGEGGILDSYTFKNLTRENEEKLKFRIESSLNTYFSEIIELIDITIVPNATLRFTEVTITYNDLLNGEQNQITVYPKEFSKKVVIKARGKFIYRAVDVAEVVRKRFLSEQVELKGVEIDSEEFKNKEGKQVRVSTIEITLAKKDTSEKKENRFLPES